MNSKYISHTSFIEPPKPVGYWILPGSDVQSIKFSAYKQPRWLTKKMMWYIFEWKWEDTK